MNLKDFVAEAERIISLHMAKRRDSSTYMHFSPEFEIDMLKEELEKKKRSLRFYRVLCTLLMAILVVLTYVTFL